MPSITITAVGRLVTPRPAAPHVAAAQPTAYPVAERGKATLLSDSGHRVVLRYAPRDSNLAGWSAQFDTLPRPGRRPLVVRTGDGSPTASLECLIAHPDHRDSIEPELAAIRAIAAAGGRVTVANMSPQEAGPWRITGVALAGSLRQPGSNHISRAVVTLTLVEVSDANPTLGPRFRRKALKKAFYFKAKKGMTVQALAAKYYGDPGLWQLITKANKMKTAKLKVGKKYKMPAYRP